MSSTKPFSEYVKVPKLKEILNGNGECEEKIERINLLLDNSDGLKKEEGSSSIGTGGGGLKLVEPTLGGVGSVGNDGYEKVLEGLSGVERKTGFSILESIEKNMNIDWDRESFEIKVDTEKIQFSDIRILLKKIVMTAGLTQPVALVMFIESLIKMKVPLSWFRSADSIQIRENLLKINRKSENNDANVDTGNNSELVNEGVNSTLLEQTESGSAEVESGLNVGESSVKVGNRRKRQLSEESEKEQTKNIKKSRIDELQLNKIRRSPRLAQSIEAVWNARKNGKQKAN